MKKTTLDLFSIITQGTGKEAKGSTKCWQETFDDVNSEAQPCLMQNLPCTYISGNIFHFFLATPSLCRKSSSMRGRPSLNLTFGSHFSNSLAFVISGFLWRGSSGVFSTFFISTSGLISCKAHRSSIKNKWFHRSDSPNTGPMDLDRYLFCPIF